MEPDGQARSAKSKTSVVRRVLDCRCDNTRIAIDADDVFQVVELAITARPPRAFAWVAGLTTHADAFYSAISLLPRESPTSWQATPQPEKAVLIHDAAGQRIALLVDRVLGLSEIETTPEPIDAPELICPPSWLWRTRAADGETRFWLDTSAIFAELAEAIVPTAAHSARETYA